MAGCIWVSPHPGPSGHPSPPGRGIWVMPSHSAPKATVAATGTSYRRASLFIALLTLMTPFRSLLLSTALLSAPAAWAQCAFTPTVAPSNLILCPNAQDTLRTQAYDSYQWLKDGQPIAGATGRTYVVEQFRDAGSEFSVAATLNGCTATAAPVLVDGWVFAGLTVMSSGSFGTDPLDGHAILCDSNALHPRDTVHFDLMPPYTTSIQWYRDGLPIVGANRPRLSVTQTGFYYVEGAPSQCARWVQTSLPLQVELRVPVPLTITFSNGQLTGGGPTGVPIRGFSWFRDGVLVPGATGATLTPPGPGAYRFQADDGSCLAVSGLFTFPVMGAPADALGSRIHLSPNPAQATLTVADAPPGARLTLHDATGRVVLLRALTTEAVDVRSLAPGLYFATVSAENGQLLRRVKVVKE